MRNQSHWRSYFNRLTFGSEPESNMTFRFMLKRKMYGDSCLSEGRDSRLVHSCCLNYGPPVKHTIVERRIISFFIPSFYLVFLTTPFPQLILRLFFLREIPFSSQFLPPVSYTISSGAYSFAVGSRKAWSFKYVLGGSAATSWVGLKTTTGGRSWEADFGRLWS